MDPEHPFGTAIGGSLVPPISRSSWFYVEPVYRENLTAYLGVSPLPGVVGAGEPALAPRVIACLALRGAPSYFGVFAAVNSAPMDALAELRALVPGAAPPLSALIRAIITADHGGGAAAMDPSTAPPPGLAPALADGRARTSSGRFARTRSPDAPPSVDDTSPGSTNADGRADGAGPAAPRLPVAVQTPDAAALAAAD